MSGPFWDTEPKSKPPVLEIRKVYYSAGSIESYPIDTEQADIGWDRKPDAYGLYYRGADKLQYCVGDWPTLPDLRMALATLLDQSWTGVTT